MNFLQLNIQRDNISRNLDTVCKQLSTKTDILDTPHNIFSNRELPLCQQSVNENSIALHLQTMNKNGHTHKPLGQQNNASGSPILSNNFLSKCVSQQTPADNSTTVCDFWPQKSEVPDEVMKELKYLKTMYVDNKCLICGFSSQSKRANRGSKQNSKHMLVHLATKPYKCDKCDRAFISSERLQSHSIIHEDKYPFSCTNCHKQFRRKKDWAVHFERMHADVKIASFICSVCSKAFTSKTELRRHYRTHTGEKLHFCSECNQGFSKYDSLETHMNKHKGIRPYKCNECEKYFFNKKYLKHHMNLHSKATSYKCSICHGTFNFKSNLAQHLKTHSQERSHGCEVCGKTFKLPHHLRQHLSTHATPRSERQQTLSNDSSIQHSDTTQVEQETLL